jgi:thioredoxin 2
MAEKLLIRCSVCGATNRVPPETLRQGEQPICGRCKTPLSADGKPVTVTDQTFPNEVERSPVPVVVDMWAPWCGPCRYLTPIVEELSAQLAGRVRVAKLNVDDNPQTASRFRIQSIPALLVFKGGREVDRVVACGQNRRSSNGSSGP